MGVHVLADLFCCWWLSLWCCETMGGCSRWLRKSTVREMRTGTLPLLGSTGAPKYFLAALRLNIARCGALRCLCLCGARSFARSLSAFFVVCFVFWWLILVHITDGMTEWSQRRSPSPDAVFRMSSMVFTPSHGSHSPPASQSMPSSALNSQDFPALPSRFVPRTSAEPAQQQAHTPTRTHRALTRARTHCLCAVAGAGV